MTRLLIVLALLLAIPAKAQALYQMPAGDTRWASPENPSGAPGQAALTNSGAKGRAFVTASAGGSVVLADITGAGVIDRMWITVDDRSFERLRALRLDIYWDGAKTPAVSVPLGDFFLQNAGEMKPLDTELFSSAEGRSFVSYIPMPYRKGAKIVVTNESNTKLNAIYYDVDYRTMDAVPDDALYFHAWWSRNRATTPGKDFEVLPQVAGRGRFLGMSVGLQSNPAYGQSWWGEGEVKMYKDGDSALPSLAGTGSEDYIGDGWGQGAYINRYQGAPVADDTTGRWSFYRFHVPDPVTFRNGLRVVYQQIGGANRSDVLALQAKGVPLIPVTLSPYDGSPFVRLLDTGQALSDPTLPKEGWANFYRSDDVSAVAYFYLDQPENGLPPLAPASERTANLRGPSKP